VPMLVLPPAVISCRPALAEGLTGADAVSILARVEAVDSRCRFLPSARHKELENYAARAERTMASQTSKASAQLAAAAGASEGRKVTCNDAALSEVADTYAAAHEAVAAADSAPKPKPVESAAKPKLEKTATKASAAVSESEMREPGATGLSQYGRLVKAYYIERKCRFLTPRQDFRFWRSIGRLHYNVVADHGAARVRPLLQRAESGAGSQSCSEGNFGAVRQAFLETIRR